MMAHTGRWSSLSGKNELRSSQWFFKIEFVPFPFRNESAANRCTLDAASPEPPPEGRERSASPALPRRPVAILLLSGSSALLEATVEFVRARVEGEALLSTHLLEAAAEGQSNPDKLAALLRERRSEAGLVILSDASIARQELLDAAASLGEASRDIIPLDLPFIEGALAAALASVAGLSAHLVAESARLKSSAPLRLDADETNDEDSEEATNQAIIEDEFGLHPGAAAQIALVSAAFDADVRIYDVTSDSGPASARSLIALGALQAKSGHCLRIEARGPDAARAASALANLISAVGRRKDEAHERRAPSRLAPRHAYAMSSGIAYGPVVALSRALPAIPVERAEDSEAEVERLLAAVDAVRHDLSTRASDESVADMLALQDVFLQDPALVDAAVLLIRNDRRNAADAFARMGAAATEVYARFEDEHLRARAADLRDAIDAVLSHLLGTSGVDLPEGEPAILLTSDLPPSLAHKLDPSRILGIIDRRGAPASHAAVLLKAAGIPAVCGADGLVPARLPTTAVFDGTTGELIFDPDPMTIRQFEARRIPGADGKDLPPTSGFATTRDGVVAELFANVSSRADAQTAFDAGALGVGLLRSEMPFLDRLDAPSEDEQFHTLHPIFEIFAGRTVIARTFDAGDDKPLPFLPRDRFSAEFATVLKTQFAALLRAGIGADLRLLLPKIAAVDEVLVARRCLVEAHERLEEEGIEHVWPVPLGIMVEIPAAALTAALLAPHVDFFSLGTNDLAQATDGISRQQARDMAPSPALLRLIRMTVEAAAAGRKPVSVCGEMASEAGPAALLFGLGVRSFSMRPQAFAGIAEIFSALSSLDIADFAERALAMPSPLVIGEAALSFTRKA